MDRDEEEIINSLLEPIDIDEIVLSGLVAFPCQDGDRVQLVGWSDAPGTMTESETPTDRVLTLRAIMPIEAYREFIRREAAKLGRS